jgi:hypothetical protein
MQPQLNVSTYVFYMYLTKSQNFWKTARSLTTFCVFTWISLNNQTGTIFAVYYWFLWQLNQQHKNP